MGWREKNAKLEIETALVFTEENKIDGSVLSDEVQNPLREKDI